MYRGRDAGQRRKRGERKWELLVAQSRKSRLSLIGHISEFYTKQDQDPELNSTLKKVKESMNSAAGQATRYERADTSKQLPTLISR